MAQVYIEIRWTNVWTEVGDPVSWSCLVKETANELHKQDWPYSVLWLSWLRSSSWRVWKYFTSIIQNYDVTKYSASIYTQGAP